MNENLKNLDYNKQKNIELIIELLLEEPPIKVAEIFIFIKAYL